MALTDYSGHVAPRKKKKRPPLRGGASSPGYADIKPPRSPEPQTPRFPTFAPQQQAPQRPEEATYGMNLKNLSTAYFEKYETFPNAMQTYFMLENAGGALWSKGEWSTLLAPGKALPSPLFNEFERLVRGKSEKAVPARNLTMGLGTAERSLSQEAQREVPEYFGGTPQDAGVAFSINEADPRMIGRKVAPPDFASVPLKLSELHNRVLVEVGGMDPAQLAAYAPLTGNMVEWKRYWADVKKAKGEKVRFDPESQAWTAGLSKEYGRYLWYRVLPYAMLSKNQAVKQAALKALDTILPEILGSYSTDPLGVTPLKFKTSLANVTDIINALPDNEAQKAYFFTSFADGRMPGDSDRKVLYDYVAEFGQNNLPADRIAEYRESLWTLNKIVAWPFEQATEGAKKTLENLDYGFDVLKEQPGMWGTVGEGLHTAWNKGLIELNPFTSSLIPMGIGYGHQAGATILDFVHDSVNAKGFEIDPADLPAEYGEDIEAYNKRMREREAAQINMQQALSIEEWTKRWDAHAGKDMFVDLADDYLNDQGVPQDDWIRNAFRDVATVASLYITLKIAGKSDMFIRKLAIREARKGFGALRFGEDVLRRRDPRSQEGFIDVGGGEGLKGKKPPDENLMDAPERMFDADEQIGVGQQAGLDIGIDTTARKTEPFAAPPKRGPEQMPGQTGMDVGKPHEGRLTRTPDLEDLDGIPDSWLTPEEIAAKRSAAPLDVTPLSRIEALEADAGNIRSVLERDAEAPMERGVDADIREGLNADLPGTSDADLLNHIKAVADDHGGLARDGRFWDSDLSTAENNKNFLGLARAGHNKRKPKGVDPISLDEIADYLQRQGLNVTPDGLWEVMQREAQRRAGGKTPGPKAMTPKETREALAQLDSIEAELARQKAAEGAPRTPTQEAAAPSPTGAGRAAEGTAATRPSPSGRGPSSVDSGPPVRTGAAPSNQYQATLGTPESPLGIPQRATGETRDVSLEMDDLKRRLAEYGIEPDSGPPVRTGRAPGGMWQLDTAPKTDPLGIPMTPKDGGPLGQQNFDTKGAGEAPPAAPPPATYSTGLPPSHPQYWHVKALMTVAEYVARYANENSASLIRRMLNLEDEALLTPEAKAGVKDAVIAMQKTHDPEVVISILDDLESKGVDTIDALGPSFFRAGRARTFENAFAAADKMGPLGDPVLKAIRIMGTPIHLNRQVPFRDADYHVRNLGVSFKMGRKKMGAADLEELRVFEQRMFEADTRLARDNVLHEFEARIIENMKEEGTWDGPKGYLAFQKSILDRRATWTRYTLGPPRKEAYGSESTVPPTYRQMHAEINAYREKAASYTAAGDDAQAAVWTNLADVGETRLNEMQAAGHIYTDEAKNPGKYRKKNEKGEQVEGNGPDGYAMNDEYNKAVQFLHDMGDEQPVWAWQLKQKLTLENLDPRFLAWYQSGKGWQKFMKWDVRYAEPFIRQWKQWTLAGVGFPLRVFAGDEFWRLPMEGINPLARQGRRKVATMRGDVSRREQKRIDELSEKQKAGTLNEREKTEFDGLKEKARPKVPDDILALISKEDMKLDADVLNIGSDYWQLLGPVKRGEDPDGTVIWDVPDDPRYLKRVQRDIGLFSEEPVIRMLMEGKNWTPETAAQAIRVLLISDTEAGAATRSLLQQTGRITAKETDIQALQRSLMRPSSGAYRNLKGIIDEWVGMYLRIDASPEMRQGLKNGHISIPDLQRVAENNPGALPTVPVGTFDRAVSGNLARYLNVGPLIYDRVTLPMMAMIGGKIRDTLFGHEYLRQMELLRKKMPDADEALLADQAAGRAANFVERTTYTRNATIFEDMVRNHLLFINSYRQFWQYWLTKMVTRPVTMSALWTMAPQKDDPGLTGAFARHFSQYMPFFLQSRVAGEERTMTPLGQIAAIATPPGFGPVESPWLGWAIRNELGTDPGLLPGQASLGGSLLPGNRIGLITEGLFNVNLPFIAQDDVTSHGMLTAYEKETVDPSAYVGGVGDQPLQSNLPQPLSAMVWVRDMVNKHGFDWMKDRVFGNPIATQQLIAAFAGAPGSLFVQKPPVYTAYTAERIKYSDLLMAGKPIEAAAYMQTTKYAKYVDQMCATTNVQDKIKMQEDMPWLNALSNSVYTYDPLGALMYDDSWVREVKPEAEAKNDLREVLRNLYGGYKYDPATGNYLDTDDATYPGDIARKVEIHAVKEHLKDITELAKAAARELATPKGVFLKKLYDDLMSDWKAKTGTFADINKFEKEPDAPDWYRDYIKAHKKELSKDLPVGYTVHAYWHPKVYAEAVAGLWKKDYQSGNWTPNDSQARTIQQMAEAGVFDRETREIYLGRDTPTGQAAARVNKEAIAKWRSHVVDVNKAAFYELDQTSLNRIGFHFGPEINDAIMKVRQAYYTWTDMVDKKAADGDTISYGSREYRDGRLKFNAYKDKVFGAVKGGEAFVGGAAERLMHTPFLTGPGTLHFTGDSAVDDAKLWKQYIKEAAKPNGDLKVVRKLYNYFEENFADKMDAYQAANDWVGITGTALTMRWIMKNSYSEYYQGPGNSMYSNYGEAMVKKLEMLISSFAAKNKALRNDIKTYGWEDAHDVSSDLLEWYYH